ncbi:MAG: hypothetical protein KAH00_06040 [Cocleimonas sp.]|nr:hypothetical protein [Cocleimonas sp.]
MKTMKTTIISDTSSLIIFSRLERHDLLKSQFDKIIVPYRVQQETLVKEDDVAGYIASNTLFEVQQSHSDEVLALLDGILDYGEAEAIALAKELGHILLIDEKKGRKIALDMGVRIIGFLGVLLLNNKQDKLSTEEAKEIMKQAKKFQFRLSERLERHFIASLR